MEKEQIEEMANDIAAMCPDLVDNGCGDLSCVACLARGLEQMGYRKQSEWISVEESFPEEGSASVVAVIYRDNPAQDWERVVTAAYLVPINGEIDGVWVLLDEKMIESKEIHITHWMPLPEPPKMEGGEE